MRHSILRFGLEGPLQLDIFLEPITGCGSRDLLAQVFGEWRFLLVPWIRTDLHILRDLVKLYLQRVCLVRGDCIGSLVGGCDGGGGGGGGGGGVEGGGGTCSASTFEWQVSVKSLKAQR
jgi:hypothetical protein